MKRQNNASMSKSNRSHLIAETLSAFAFLVLATACSNQSEGQRCSQENGNEDCGDNLICVDGNELGTDSDICCPEGVSEEPACIPGSLGNNSTTSSTGGGGTGAMGGGGTGGGGMGGGGTGGMGGGGMGGGGTGGGGTGGQGGMGGGGSGA